VYRGQYLIFIPGCGHWELEYTFIVAALVIATCQSVIIIHTPKKVLDDLIITWEVLVLIENITRIISSRRSNILQLIETCSTSLPYIKSPLCYLQRVFWGERCALSVGLEAVGTSLSF
jgi:branched-subunit amino acid ABC-type transport system permease component